MKRNLSVLSLSTVSYRLFFDRHLYQPLIYKSSKNDLVEVKPVALNDGERDFVIDFKDLL